MVFGILLTDMPHVFKDGRLPFWYRKREATSEEFLFPAHKSLKTFEVHRAPGACLPHILYFDVLWLSLAGRMKDACSDVNLAKGIRKW